MKRLAAAATVAVLALTATGCYGDEDDKGLGDAPVATNTATGKKGGDNAPGTITNMPDNYGNVATKCVAGRKPWAIIEGTNFSGNSIFLAVQDPASCGGAWVPGPVAVPGGVSTQPPPDDGS